MQAEIRAIAKWEAGEDPDAPQVLSAEDVVAKLKSGAMSVADLVRAPKPPVPLTAEQKKAVEAQLAKQYGAVVKQ